MFSAIVDFILLSMGFVLVVWSIVAWRCVPAARRMSRIIHEGAGSKRFDGAGDAEAHCGQVVSFDGKRRVNSTVSSEELLYLLRK